MNAKVPKLFSLPSSSVRTYFKTLSNIYEPAASYVETKKVFSVYELVGENHFEVLNYDGSLTTPGKFPDVDSFAIYSRSKIFRRMQ